MDTAKYIIVDLDNVLADSDAHLRAKVREIFKVDLPEETDPDGSWLGFADDTATDVQGRGLWRMIDFIFSQTDYFDTIPVMPGAKEGMAVLRARAEARGLKVIIVSHCVGFTYEGDVVGQAGKLRWLMRNFPEIHPSDLFVVGDKWPFVPGADAIIEDHLPFLIDVAGKIVPESRESGMPRLVCFSRPWNENIDRYRKQARPIRRAVDWNQVVEQVFGP